MASAPAGGGSSDPKPRSDARPAHGAPSSGAKDEVACQGHAFGEDLACACGTTWWHHQRLPRPCPLNAQRCHRTRPAPSSP